MVSAVRSRSRRPLLGRGADAEQLAAFLLDRDEIARSDQGQSFQASFDYLLSLRSQQELRELLQQVNQLPQLDSRANQNLLGSPSRGWRQPRTPRTRPGS
ncbi:DUF3375 family protein [Streptomyces galilaeus]|uniref:DUF3375 family protein n=1 Tax=Streptomyces galilaeus TaxID=33899 RepID=UPI001E358868|nr:DUF3375 family protein [Streptomyces galilaeus]